MRRARRGCERHIECARNGIDIGFIVGVDVDVIGVDIYFVVDGSNGIASARDKVEHTVKGTRARNARAVNNARLVGRMSRFDVEGRRSINGNVFADGGNGVTSEIADRQRCARRLLARKIGRKKCAARAGQ